MGFTEHGVLFVGVQGMWMCTLVVYFVGEMVFVIHKHKKASVYMG